MTEDNGDGGLMILGVLGLFIVAMIVWILIVK